MKLTSLILFSVLLGLVQSASAAPVGWEPDFGAEIAALTGNDDTETSVVLSFPFPFAGTDYTTVFVTNNGAIQLGNLGTDSNISLGLSSNLSTFFDDGGFPVISAFNTDLDLSSTGTIHLNDFGDRAVFTWNEVGTDSEELHLSSFQIHLFADGRIYFSYNGILDDPGEDLVDSLGNGILVGISGSTGTDPGVSDLSVPNSTLTDTLYEVWNDSSAPENSLFDLDLKTLVFAPKSGGGFTAYFLELTTGTGIPDLLIGKKANSLKGDGVRDAKRPSTQQTIVHSAGIFSTNTSKVTLVLQNDGAIAGTFNLRSFDDDNPRMKVSARASGGGNISAALQTGRFSPTIEAGGSLRVSYRLTTERFYAGVIRDGDRDDTVRFKLSGGGIEDNAAMTNRYK